VSAINRFHIRDAREDERAATHDLTWAAYAEYATIMAAPAWEGLRAVLEATLDAWAPAERIVAEQDGALIGSVMLYPPTVQSYGDIVAGPNWPELRLLAVAPAARRHGVARALVEECERRAQRAGATTLGLHTSESMRAAIQMYERMGFVRVPEHDFRIEDSELITAYRRDLSRAAHDMAGR
jgi:ribosomal protein S18 acetylase RimI-like enzyme